jgi:predicted PurR-regulated permease PerM
LSQEQFTGRQELPEPTVLRQIVRLLAGILVLLVIAFCFFASSICITIIFAAFLSILADPAVRRLERLRIPRFFGVTAVILAGVMALGCVIYVSYAKLADFSDDFPGYVSRIADAVSPISNKIQRVQDSAGTLANQAAPRKVPEVRIRENTSWASYLARGVGSVSGRSSSPELFRF